MKIGWEKPRASKLPGVGKLDLSELPGVRKLDLSEAVEAFREQVRKSGKIHEVGAAFNKQGVRLWETEAIWTQLKTLLGLNGEGGIAWVRRLEDSHNSPGKAVSEPIHGKEAIAEFLEQLGQEAQRALEDCKGAMQVPEPAFVAWLLISDDRKEVFHKCLSSLRLSFAPAVDKPTWWERAAYRFDHSHPGQDEGPCSLSRGDLGAAVQNGLPQVSAFGTNRLGDAIDKSASSLAMVQCAWEEAGSRMARVHEEAFDADGNARPVNVRLIMEDRGR